MVQTESRPDFEPIVPTSEDYALLPIAEAFTWDGCVGEADAGEWYLVVFRSVLKEHADLVRLWDQDHRAFEEAAAAPGFVHYFKGPLNERRECLSFCVWDSREHARDAARAPAHMEAIALIHEMYESYVLEFVRMRTWAGASGFEFEAYDHAGAA